MAKYLYKTSYTVEGLKGLLKQGGSKRKEAAEKAIQSLGGKLEAFYFAFGKNDCYLIVDLPDAASAAALSMVVAASGMAKGTMTVLITPQEMDAATKKSVSYAPPAA